MHTNLNFYFRDVIDRILENRRICILILVALVVILAFTAFDLGKYFGAFVYLITH